MVENSISFPLIFDDVFDQSGVGLQVMNDLTVENYAWNLIHMYLSRHVFRHKC